jgi:predicted O-methyltransferase YrrM
MKILFRPEDQGSFSKFPLLKHPVCCLLGLRGVISQHSEAEDQLLRKYADRAEVIVEIGVAEGASAYALGSTVSTSGQIYLIDPYLPGRVPLFNATKLIAHRLLKHCTCSEIIWIEQFSHEAIKNWDQSIDFLFIDGDHSYQGCLKDWQDWHSFVKPGGIVAFHDARVFPEGWTAPDWGSVHVVQTLFRNQAHPDWKIIDEVDSLVIVQRQ